MDNGKPLSDRALTFMLCGAAVAILSPLWLPLCLAAWFADLLWPAVHRLERALGGRRRAAAAAVVLLALVALVPISAALVTMGSTLSDLLLQVRAALEGQGSLVGVLLGGPNGTSRPAAGDWANLAARYGADAWRTLITVARASASAVVGSVVFIASLYTFASEGDRLSAWLGDHVPIARGSFERFAHAFRETGRGLLVAGGGTALVQGAVATFVYVAIGVPRPILFGALTTACAIVPVVGTGLVWVPLGIELFVMGHYWQASLVLFLGMTVIGLIDNLVRPVLARYGRLNLPTLVVFLSMVGGAALLGAAGALLGPLTVRLCVEALAILVEAPRTSRFAACPHGGTVPERLQPFE